MDAHEKFGVSEEDLNMALQATRDFMVRLNTADSKAVNFNRNAAINFFDRTIKYIQEKNHEKLVWSLLRPMVPGTVREGRKIYKARIMKELGIDN